MKSLRGKITYSLACMPLAAAAIVDLHMLFGSRAALNDYERLLARADDVDAGTQIIRIWAVVPSWVRSVMLSQ